MVKNVNHDTVATILSRLQDTGPDEQPELPLEYEGGCEARDYYQVLSEVVDTISCVASILKHLPEHVVKASDMRIKIEYSDSVVGTLVMTGEEHGK